MPKLNDTQLLLLVHAAQRDSGSFYPLPDTLNGATRATTAITSLVKLGMAEQRETTNNAAVSRTEEDQRFGVFITPAGLEAIGVARTGNEDRVDRPTTPLAVEPKAKLASKTDAVLTLLRRDQGATLPELIEATGWLPHTTRAALTGLRKRGHTVARGKRDEVTCYTIAVAAQA